MSEQMKMWIVFLFLWATGYYTGAQTGYENGLDEGVSHDSLSSAVAEVHDLHTEYIGQMKEVLDIFTGGSPVIFTAYNALVNQTDDTPTITASNKTIAPGMIAMSREFIDVYGHGGEISFGDSVWVVIKVEVEDTMNKRWRDRVDIYMDKYSDAIKFGKRHGYVFIK